MARIAALQAENRQLTERVVKLEEELALARLHRFAPKREKHIDRLFNEAEQATDEDAADNEDGDVVALPDTGLPAGVNFGRRLTDWSCDLFDQVTRKSIESGAISGGDGLWLQTSSPV
ncbi:transposase (plasmid) [Sinorhizobium americanum CCGM7]|nr:transposase [Sinorhizobium americanum CCGM7]